MFRTSLMAEDARELQKVIWAGEEDLDKERQRVMEKTMRNLLRKFPGEMSLYYIQTL